MKEVYMKQEWGQIENWAGIVGRWRVDGKSVNYSATDPQAAFSFGIAIGSGRLRSGSITATIDLGKKHNANEARLIFGYDPLTRDYFSAGLGGYGGAYALDQFDQGFGWRNLVLAGIRDNLDETKTFNVRVDILGNQVTLRVDDVLVAKHILSKPLPGDQLGLLAVGPGEVIFENISYIASKPRAFIVMQFGEPFDSIYSEVIAPVCNAMGFDAFRADDIYTSGIILQDIITGIKESEIVIAEITPANPNVFYELGYSHALSKTTILLAERDNLLPFDVQGYRCIFYDNTISGKRDVEDALRKHLENILHE